MPRGHLKEQLEQSLVQDSFVISDVSNTAGYRPANTTDYFFIGATVSLKNHSFSNDEETTNYAFGATPVNLPANPALNATLTEIFDDYFVYWRWNGATWDKLTEENRYVYVQLSYYAVGVIASQTNYVVPPTLNGFKVKSVSVFLRSAGNIAGLQVITKNAALAGPLVTVGANAGASFNDGVTTFAFHDEIAVAVANVPAAPCLFSITLTLQKP